MKISNKIKNLPATSGIYLFYNRDKELVYVGKATSLKDRVKSYFIGNRAITRPIEEMIHEVADIKYKTTDSVLEAVILEAIYIRKYKPLYNVLGKDDKSWNYIVITNDEYPRVETVRGHEIEQIRGVIARRPGPPKADRLTWQSPSSKGGLTKIEGDPHGPMGLGMTRFKYVFGPYPGLNRRAAMKVLRRIFHFSECHPDQGRPCLYYHMGQCLGVCIRAITPEDYKKKVIRPLATFLSGKKKQLIKDLEKQMKIAGKAENFEEAGRIRDQLQALYRIHDVALLNESFFNIGSPELIPSESKFRRVEGYDVSNLGATNMVGSMVVFNEYGPVKDEYRLFNIKTVAGQSDVDALEEVLRRRLRHLERTGRRGQYWPLPDVILIDGGAPQVNRVKLVLEEEGIKISLLGIAKGPERKRNDFIAATKDPEFIRWVEQNRNLLIQVRDEAHRFAVSAHRRKRGKQFRKK